ncbi:MAG: endonuclease/exonuclease/phosphatase family protein [Myxococcales bacterium]|nr:endonuclease/exonuclease/phosphatase family protein [Myxococcales bacterium]
MRLLTWNIHKGIGGRDRRYRLERIVDVITEQAPDVLCLQEVDSGVPRSSLDHQPEVLAERLQMPYSVYQRNVDVREGGYGNLILSRFPLTWQHDMSLRLKWRKPRGAQFCVVQAPGGEVLVVNWHLGLAEAERQWQVKTLLESEPLSAYAHLPTIIAGDTNDWRDQLQQARFAPAGFTCATSPAKDFRSFPAYLPLGALDKAFIRGELTVVAAQVIKNLLTRDASDHLPLVLEMAVNGRSPAK